MAITPPSTAKPSEDFKVAWEKMSSSNPKDALNSSARAIAKLIQTARKNPKDPKQRRIRMDNIIVKKFISKIVGAEDFMHSVGYHTTSVNNTVYLELDESKANSELLQEAENFLIDHSTGVDELLSGESITFHFPPTPPTSPMPSNQLIKQPLIEPIQDPALLSLHQLCHLKLQKFVPDVLVDVDFSGNYLIFSVCLFVLACFDLFLSTPDLD